MSTKIIHLFTPKPTENGGLFIEGVYGVCPRESDGLFNDRPYYFRARGETWTLTLNPYTSKERVIAVGKYTGSALGGSGWMDESEVRKIIEETYIAWVQTNEKP